MDLKRCPHSHKHQVTGGRSVYVCLECGTEWFVVKRKSKTCIRYNYFNSDGDIIRTWKVPIKGEADMAS